MPVIAPLVAAIVNSVASTMVDQPNLAPTAPVYQAMERAFPADAKRGELVPPIQQPVWINGVQMNVAPGLQVRNQQNFIVMPASLQETVPVRYQLDLMGNVWRIWILSAAEAAAPDPTK